MIEILDIKHDKSIAWANLLGYRESSSYSSPQLHDINLDFLQSFIKYLTRLKKEKKISDREFSAFLAGVYSNYVANEIDIRVKRIFEKYL